MTVSFVKSFLHRSASGTHYLRCSSFSSVELENSIPVSEKQGPPFRVGVGPQGGSLCHFHSRQADLTVCAKKWNWVNVSFGLPPSRRTQSSKAFLFPVLPSNSIQTLDGLLRDLMAPHWSDQILWISHTHNLDFCLLARSYLIDNWDTSGKIGTTFGRWMVIKKNMVLNSEGCFWTDGTVLVECKKEGYYELMKASL